MPAKASSWVIDSPIRLPGGRASAGTSPEPTGSPAMKMIGITVVSFPAALAAGVLTAMITLGFNRTRSRMSSGKRSLRPSAHRISRAMFWPSM